MNKSEIEQEIVDAWQQVNASSDDATWITSSELLLYGKAFSRLRNYYDESRDSDEIKTISSHVLSTYFQSNRLFQKMYRNPEFSALRDIVADRISGFDYLIEHIIEMNVHQNKTVSSSKKSDDSQIAEIEDEIVHIGKRVKWSRRKFDWLSSEELSKLIDAFNELIDIQLVQSQNDDKNFIRYDVLSTLWEGKRYLYEIVHKPKFAEYHGLARPRLKEFEDVINRLFNLESEPEDDFAVISSKEKSEIEREIVRTWNKVKWSNQEFDWLESNQLENFLGAWRKLEAHYKRNMFESEETNSINFSILSVYFLAERLFYQILRNPDLTKYHMSTLDRLAALQQSMDNLIGVNYQRIHVEEDEEADNE